MGDTTLKGSTIAASYDWLIFRGDDFSDTGNKISLMDNEGVVQPSNLYIDPTNDRVGIGTSAPDGILHLDNDTSNTYLVLEKDGGTSAGIEFHNETSHAGFIHMNTAETISIENDISNGDIDFRVNDNGVDTIVMTLDGATGNVGIGIATPDVSKVRIQGNGTDDTTNVLFCEANNGTDLLRVADNGTIFMGNIASSDGNLSVQFTSATGEITKHTSDMNLKKNIQDADINSLALINNLKIRNYEWKTLEDVSDDGKDYNYSYGDDMSGTKLGVIAQEVNAVITDFCDLDEKDGLYGMNYPKFIPYLLKAVQELSAKVTALENA